MSYWTDIHEGLGVILVGVIIIGSLTAGVLNQLRADRRAREREEADDGR